MHRLTFTQRIKFIKTYYKNGYSATTMYRALRGNYEIEKKLEETGVITNIERPVHQRFARSTENNHIVSESVAEYLNMPNSRRSRLS